MLKIRKGIDRGILLLLSYNCLPLAPSSQREQIRDSKGPFAMPCSAHPEWAV